MAEEAAGEAAGLGIDVGVLDLRTLVPLDVDGLLEAVARTGRAIVVQESPLTCGFAAEVAATIVEHIFDALHAPVLRVSGFDVPIPMPQLEDDYFPSVKRIVAAITSSVSY
jgi:pyruvate dehydrogenase E1 component beta subunit